MTTTELELMVPFVNFQKRYLLQRDEILSAVDNVLASGVYILGEWVIELEKIGRAHV